MKQPSSTTAQRDNAPMSSQEYLQKLRQRRLNRQAQNKQVQDQTTAPPIEPKTKSETKPVQTAQNTASKQQEEDEGRFPGVPKPRPKKTIMSWRAPTRPFKKRDSHYYFTIVAIVVLISLILFFAGQFLSIAVVISVGFLAYVLSSVAPQDVDYEISTYGIKIADELYYWEEMGRFWFEAKYDQELLTIEVVRFPGRLIILFKPEQKEEIEDLLSEVLLKEKPADTFYDKAANWLKEKIPLDITS